MLYGIPLDRIKKGNPEYSYRQNGKAATLALGYGGGAPALIRVGRLQRIQRNQNWRISSADGGRPIRIL